jgi:formimidoylglutamate deiminase
VRAGPGARPVEWLLANAGLDEGWCVIHATHMTEAERHGLATSGPVSGLCPLTEANLADGRFELAGYRHAGGRFGIGTDANLLIDLPASCASSNTDSDSARSGATPCSPARNRAPERPCMR